MTPTSGIVYAEIKAIPNNQIDAYAILLRDGDDCCGFRNKPDSLYTIGARLAGNVENVGVDYTVEIPFQFGDTGTQMGSPTATDGSFGGYAIFVKGGYTVPGENKIRLGAEYNFGSGDDNSLTDSTHNKQFVDMGLGTNHAALRLHGHQRQYCFEQDPLEPERQGRMLPLS